MNTQELKKYIDRVLGNKIRCLLPSFWWKKIFREVVDRVDEVEQSTSKLIESKVEEVKMPIVESVDEMENLKLAKGRVAAVEKVGESETVKISDCYFSLNREEDWDKYTIVKGVEEKDVILDKDVTAYVMFSASKETMTKDVLQVIVESGRFYYMKCTDYEPSVSSLDEVNKALYSGKYRAIFYSNAPDDYFTFYLAKPQPSLYIKGDSWEMLTKENVVNSEDELDRLIVPYGSIAKVNSKKYGKINPFNCYRIISTSQPSSDAVKRNWDKLKRITQIDVTNPDTEPSSLPIMYLHGYANFNGDLIKISYYNGYKIATSNGSTTVASFDDLNSLLKNSDYRLLAISDTDEHREFFDKYVSLYSPDFIVPNAYIKGDSWERLAKESDLEGNEGGSEDDNSGVEIRDLYIYQNYDGTFTQLTEEQKAWNLETLELVKQGKVIVRTTLNGMAFILELFNEDNEYQFGYTQFSPSGGMAISVYVAEDGLSGIKIEESHFDSELSTTSINAVQNKVITAALNEKQDKCINFIDVGICNTFDELYDKLKDVHLSQINFLTGIIGDHMITNDQCGMMYVTESYILIYTESASFASYRETQTIAVYNKNSIVYIGDKENTAISNWKEVNVSALGSNVENSFPSFRVYYMINGENQSPMEMKYSIHYPLSIERFPNSYSDFSEYYECVVYVNNTFERWKIYADGDIEKIS